MWFFLRAGSALMCVGAMWVASRLAAQDLGTAATDTTSVSNGAASSSVSTDTNVPMPDAVPPVANGPVPLAGDPAVQVTVDAAQVLRTVDDRMFGVNTAVWDGAFKDSQTLPLVQAADLRTLRFPGGSTSDTYDWQTNKSYISTSDSAYVPGVRTLNSWSWTNSFDEFAAIALALKAKVFITANYGSGTAQQAADWVTYSNKTKGYGFKYWEIGNECYGSWEEDIHAAKWDPVTYANEAKAYITAMKAADATVKIGVVVQTGEDNLDARSPVHNVTNPRTGAAHHGWTAVMLATLKSLGVTPDYVIYHRYPLAPGSETDAKLLSGVSISATTWADDAADLRRQVNDYLGAAGAGVELVVTENNDVYSDPGKQSTSLVNGLFYADSCGQLLQTEFKAFVWWTLHNGSPRNSVTHQQTGYFGSSIYGWRTYGDYGVLSANDDVNPVVNDPHPTYYAMKLISHFIRAGDRVVKATSGNPLLATYAAHRKGDGTLTMLVINKSPTETLTGQFSLNGFVYVGGSIYAYGKAQDEAARSGVGARDLSQTALAISLLNMPSGIESGKSSSHSTDVRQGLGSLATNSLLSLNFEPYSMSVIVFNPEPPPAPAQLAAYASDPNTVSLTWQAPTDGFGITGYKLERATNSAFSAGLTTMNLSAATSYVDSNVIADTTYYYRVSATNMTGTVNASASVQVKTSAVASSGSARLVNISTRAYCSTGNNVTIGGFVISGSVAKRVLVRAIGPSLTAQGLVASELLADPTIEVHDALHGNAVVATNDDAGDNANVAAIASVGASIGATALLDTDTKSSALLTMLNPGVYSFVVTGRGGASGIALLEVYDADATQTGATFANISTRADCTTGNGVTIGGFVVAGSGPKRVLLRAVGPTLTTQGIGAVEVLQDPMIELHDANHGNAIIATNDNWNENGNAADITTTGARIGATPLADDDTTSAGLLLSLQPGVYSFVVRGKSDTTGITLVEVYDAD